MSLRIYTVHMLRPTLDPVRDIRLVKEGFNWPAFFFSFLWALCNRLWAAAAVLLTADIILNGVIAVLGGNQVAQLAVSVGLALVVGLIGNDLKRWTLFRRGFLEVGVVSGEDRSTAERRFWDQRPHLAADLVR